MRIMVVLPAARGLQPAVEEERRAELMELYSKDDVRITLGFPEEDSGLRPFGGDWSATAFARNQMAIAQRMIQAEQEGFDACVPWGMPDFGVEIARTACAIPIVGQSQAAYCMAAMMASRIGVIGYQSQSFALFWRQMRDYGFLHLLVGMGAAEMTNTEMRKQPQQLFDRFVGEGKRLVRDGADLIVCHGMQMSPVMFTAAEYTEGIGVPVLEGLGCAIAMAEAWVRTGTPYSRIRYPMPG